MTMRCNEITPCSALRPFIDRYWCWTEEPSAPRRLPGTGHELMLHFGTPWRARALDQELLLRINEIWSNPFFDRLMPIASSMWLG